MGKIRTQLIVVKALIQLVNEGEAVLTRYIFPATEKRPAEEKYIYKIKT